MPHHRTPLLAVAVLAATLAAPARGEDAPAKQPQRPYKVAHDAPLEAAEKLDTRAAGYTRYRVEFNGIKGDRVPAFLYVPARDAKRPEAPKHPAVLLQYGSGGSKTTNYIVALGEQFVRSGFVVLTIDVPNRGERRKNAKDWKEWFNDRGGTMLQTCGDYSRAVDYLLTREDVDPDRVGYAGISMGAITGITFAAHDPRIKAMASIVGGGNLLGSLKVEPTPEAKAAAAKVDPANHVGLIAPRPLLLLNATRDQLVPRFFAESLHEAAGGHAKKVWVETDHFFTGVDRYQILDGVIEFMHESLAAPAAGEGAADDDAR